PGGRFNGSQEFCAMQCTSKLTGIRSSHDVIIALVCGSLFFGGIYNVYFCVSCDRLIARAVFLSRSTSVDFSLGTRFMGLPCQRDQCRARVSAVRVRGTGTRSVRRGRCGVSILGGVLRPCSDLGPLRTLCRKKGA